MHSRNRLTVEVNKNQEPLESVDSIATSDPVLVKPLKSVDSIKISDSAVVESVVVNPVVYALHLKSAALHTQSDPSPQVTATT